MKWLKKIWQRIFKAWMSFAHVLGIINTAILLTLVYAVMIIPIRMVLFMLRKDLLHLRAYRTGPHWVPRSPEPAELAERRHPF